ncbi:magnesium transporter, partial [Marinitenerispora sediminis]
VMVGLTGVLLLFPHTSAAPAMATGTAVLLVAAVVALGAAGYAAAHRIPAGARAVLLAALGGVALGTTSALARVVAAATASDLAAVLSWLTVLAVAVALFGGLLQQNAYRTGHFAAAYATLLVVDPVTGAAIGTLLLGEGVPATTPDRLLAAGSAVLAIVGTAVLARAENRNPEADRRLPENPTRPGSDLVHTSSGEVS